MHNLSTGLQSVPQCGHLNAIHQLTSNTPAPSALCPQAAELQTLLMHCRREAQLLNGPPPQDIADCLRILGDTFDRNLLDGALRKELESLKQLLKPLVRATPVMFASLRQIGNVLMPKQLLAIQIASATQAARRSSS